MNIYNNRYKFIYLLYTAFYKKKKKKKNEFSLAYLRIKENSMRKNKKRSNITSQKS